MWVNENFFEMKSDYLIILWMHFKKKTVKHDFDI